MATLSEKIRQRRRDLKESLVNHDQSDNERTPRSSRSKNDTWAAAMEEDAMEMTTMTGQEQNAEMLDEVREAETLMQNLTMRRKDKQKQLTKELASDGGNFKGQMRDAKKRSRQKILEAQKLSGGEDEDEDDVDHEDEEDNDDDGVIEVIEDEETAVVAVNGDIEDGETPRKAVKPSKSDKPPTPRERKQESRGSTESPVPKGGKDLKLTLREKLKLKMASAKEEAEEAEKDKVQTGRGRLRDRLDAPIHTRFDDPTELTKDEVEAEKMLEKSMNNRVKWKKAADKVTSKVKDSTLVVKSIFPTKDESYNFFTSNWDADDGEDDEKPEQPKKEVKKEEEPQPGTSGENAEEGEPLVDKDKDVEKVEERTEDTEESAPLISDFDDPSGEWRKIVIGRADYTANHKRLEEEGKKYFIPSMISIPTEKKIFDEEAPRFLEDEGFYVGVRPSVAQRNVNRVEDRLLHQDNKGENWFGEDGRVIALPNPIKAIQSRPLIPEEIEPAFETEYRKAITKEFDSRFIDGRSQSQGKYQLDVDINALTFSHHHLFSREHILATRLADLNQRYLTRNQQNLAEFFSGKLTALKISTQHLEEHIKTMKTKDKPVTGLQEQEARLRDYRTEIREMRQRRDNEQQADRNLIKNIITTWKELKTLRQSQGCTNTSIKLQIRKEDVGKQGDEEKWKQEIEEEVEEVREEMQLVYDEAMQRYQKLLDAWKTQRKEKKAALRRRKLLNKRGDEENEDAEENAENEQQRQADEKLLDEEDLPKPEAPAKFDAESCRAKVKEKALQIRRRPGEHKLHPELSYGATITPKTQCPRGEQARRDEVDRSKVFVKVLFNNKEVSRTTVKPLGQEFKVNFAQIFNILIVQWPESIKIQIFESRGITSHMIAELFVPIPEGTVTTETAQLEEIEFSTDQRVQHSHEGVGSGVYLSLEADGSNIQSYNTTGELATSVAWAVDDTGNPMVPPSNIQVNNIYNVAWAVDDTGNPMVPPSNIQVNNIYNAMKQMDAVAAIGATGMTDLDKLSDWIQKSRLDPNDPSNADLMYLLKGSNEDATARRVPNHFRIEHLQEEFNFCSDEDINQSLRYKLLEYREMEIAEFRNYKMIPCVEAEVPPEIFNEYEKKKKEEEKIKQGDALEEHRDSVMRFMQRVRENVIQRFRAASHQKTLADMVIEEAVPNVGTIIPSLVKITEPRRPLRPTRKERKKVTAQNLQSTDVKILINIVRAFDIPVRSEAVSSGNQSARGTQSQDKSKLRNIAGQTLVRPVIEVVFQRNKEQTTVGDGPNPSWNEELEMPFKAPNNDYSSTNLQTVNDVVFLNLFDEVLIDVLEDERQRGTNIQKRIERKWLGGLKLPFSTIYFNTRIDGTFKLNKPPVLLGYTHDTRSTHIDTGGGQGLDMGMGDPDNTYITLFITIEPQLTPAEPAKEKFDTNEDEKLIEYAESWQTALEKKFEKRVFTTSVIDVNGKTVFVTRYFKSLKPPDEILNDNAAPLAQAESCARFVSMIPFISDSVVFPGLCDIWSTCDQFLSMLAGDEEEHAMLLTNYFLHLGKQAWMLLGSAIPEGETSYVLSKENDEYWIWNASTGERYNARDNYCPVQSVGCLMNQDNVWANIQVNDQPSRMNFNLKDDTSWKPFFDKSFPNPGLSSVQPEALIYVPTRSQNVMDIQSKIEQTLKAKIMEWRPRNITRWNRFCMQAFRTLLPRLEATRGKGMQDETIQELASILSNYKLSGFPINLPFTDLEPIIETVYSTGVWFNESSDVEFALAVHVHAYPNSVLSVWVYVASLIRKR
ncbi:unnamed protein product [Owenia fusiformis]|uniref:Coiled-coil and C2 domain-containing protein 2A n=1 Tax=Owenia fusiformis TaxID=6347 RepID=A0A8S4MZP7_OWEFU|nr:unnamed protein product [Owenia fusiformis]